MTRNSTLGIKLTEGLPQSGLTSNEV